MPDLSEQTRTMMRERLNRYLRLRDEHGDEKAREILLEGYPERQAERMGPRIEGRPLIEGFREALAVFAQMGFQEESLDMSRDGVDAVMQVCRTCMCVTAAAELDVEPTPVLCELDFEATRRAFPDMTVEGLLHQAEGRHVCVFRYARPESAANGAKASEADAETA
ncbi:transcriptional regulator [Actinomadura darangshiensis]|uniref:Transcriptional regulator n=1 Tax=Actinomadura darangshiensis TaxID=705336 RepID=A0A4R5BZ07_9ACTN|nr:L-2-amino-thiazoline-4-carboxylic acid hydrolase [Actinomadura darangshiensis]TDD89612.1 transcriptional regulator [Actinomadura darangshiensis]